MVVYCPMHLSALSRAPPCSLAWPEFSPIQVVPHWLDDIEVWTLYWSFRQLEWPITLLLLQVPLGHAGGVLGIVVLLEDEAWTKESKAWGKCMVDQNLFVSLSCEDSINADEISWPRSWEASSHHDAATTMFYSGLQTLRFCTFISAFLAIGNSMTGWVCTVIIFLQTVGSV